MSLWEEVIINVFCAHSAHIYSSKCSHSKCIQIGHQIQSNQKLRNVVNYSAHSAYHTKETWWTQLSVFDAIHILLPTLRLIDFSRQLKCASSEKPKSRAQFRNRTQKKIEKKFHFKQLHPNRFTFLNNLFRLTTGLSGRFENDLKKTELWTGHAVLHVISLSFRFPLFVL